MNRSHKVKCTYMSGNMWGTMFCTYRICHLMSFLRTLLHFPQHQILVAINKCTNIKEKQVRKLVLFCSNVKWIAYRPLLLWCGWLLHGSECICGYASAILMHTNIDCNYRYDNLGEQLWACHKKRHWMGSTSTAERSAHMRAQRS